jgi:hypothetical protein
MSNWYETRKLKKNKENRKEVMLSLKNPQMVKTIEGKSGGSNSPLRPRF